MESTLDFLFFIFFLHMKNNEVSMHLSGGVVLNVLYTFISPSLHHHPPVYMWSMLIDWLAAGVNRQQSNRCWMNHASMEQASVKVVRIVLRLFSQTRVCSHYTPSLVSGYKKNGQRSISSELNWSQDCSCFQWVKWCLKLGWKGQSSSSDTHRAIAKVCESPDPTAKCLKLSIETPHSFFFPKYIWFKVHWGNSRWLLGHSIEWMRCLCSC